jgi:hypothetical protein
VEKPKHARRQHTAASQLSRHSFAGASRSICAHSTCTLAPLRQDRAGMYTGGLCSQRGLSVRRLAGPLASLFLSCGDLRTAKQSIQDQQKQIRGQYNRRHARNRKHQGFPRFVVTSKPLDLHGQRPIKNLTAAVTSTHGG